jgi:tRNA pseudouridine13 synthase
VSVPQLERQIGIEVYATKTVGVGGAIRRGVEDFVVEEILVDGSKATVEASVGKAALGASGGRQRFLLCMLVKRNWDTFIAIKNVAKELGIDQARISVAGIKDAKAITTQHITIEGVAAEDLAKVHVKDVALRFVGYFHESLCAFYLLGNRFKIVVREIQSATAQTQIQATWSELGSVGGIPNFYGHQRFGTARAITHQIGKALVHGDLEQAAMLLLAQPSPHEHPTSRQARAQLQATGDFKAAMEAFPVQLRFERVMLGHLVECPGDFAGAFRRLPLKLRLLFVQAWQSYLFNRFLSARLKAGLGLGEAVVGDFVVNVERSGLPMVKLGKLVDSSNVAEVNGLVAAGKMRVALPIFGAKQRLSEGKMGELERQILEAEGVDAAGFRVSVLPELGARGELRAAVCPVKGFNCAVTAENGGACAALEFTLLRGAYATVLLREIIKPPDPITAGF